MAYEFSKNMSLVVPTFDPGAVATSAAIDSAWVFGTSGDGYFVRFMAPADQTDGSLKVNVHVVDVTGTASFQLAVYAGEDTGDLDRPKAGSSDLAGSPSTLTVTSADNNTWCELSCTASLVASKTYFAVVKNTSADATAAYATFRYRGNIDSFTVISEFCYSTGDVTTGFNADPRVLSTVFGCAITVFANSSQMGIPYVGTETHANNTNSRGNRFTFPVNTVVSGIYSTSRTSAIASIGIYPTNSSTAVVVVNVDQQIESRSGLVRFAPTTLTAGTAYDVVLNYSGNSTSGEIYTMVEAKANVPADVLACTPFGIVGYVDGSVGSMTLDESKLFNVSLLVDNFPTPEAATGGATSHVFIS